MKQARVNERAHARVDELQKRVAQFVAALDLDLSLVPHWTTQLLAWSLANAMQRDQGDDTISFSAFAERSQGYGSALFPDSPDAIAPAELAADLLRHPMGDDALGVLSLLSKSLDYGRSNLWRMTSKGVSRKRSVGAAKALGVFYTPNFIASYLVDRTVEAWTQPSPPRVCDPSVGSGVFLRAMAIGLSERFPRTAVLDALFGVDIDPLAVEVAAIGSSFLCDEWVPGMKPPTLGTHLVVGDAYSGPADMWPACTARKDDSSKKPWSTCISLDTDFDIVMTNPPFGRHKVDGNWAAAQELGMTKEDVNRLRSQRALQSTKLRSSGWYRFSTRGVVDMSRIGLERATQLVKPGGQVAAVVPSTVNADGQSEKLRRHLLEDFRLIEILEVPEGARLFEGVNQSISVVHLEKGKRTSSILVRSGIRSKNDLARTKSIAWPISVIRGATGRMAIPVRSGHAEDVIQKIHAQPTIAELPHIANLRGEVDLTVFRDFLTRDSSMTPLVRGDQIERFRSSLPSDKPRYVETEAYRTRLAGSPKLLHSEHARIVGRQCSYLYRHERLSFSMASAGSAVANSCNYLLTEDDELLAYLLGILNSTLLNWRFKLFNSNNHVSNYEISEFPIPSPTRLPKGLYQRIAVLSTELNSNYDDSRQLLLDDMVFEAFGLSSDQAKRVQDDERVRPSDVE